MIFLYPWFLLLLIVPVAFWWIGRSSENSGAWATVCDPHLLPHLTVPAQGKVNHFYRGLMVALWCLGVIALAGPALPQRDLPSAQAQTGIVVAIDMSPAMSKEAANQMSRKLYDLLQLHKDATIGLVLADNYAYTALPMTQDKSIFKNLIPTLKERIMPSAGQNIDAAITKAGELLLQSGFKNGQILLITAGVTDTNELAKAVQKSIYPVSVLGVGNEKESHPVLLPSGQFWGGETPKMVSLSGLPNVLGKKYETARIDESDLKQLLKPGKLDKIEKDQSTLKQYQNIGIYLVVLMLPFAALLFRRGILWVVIVMLLASPAHAGFWWRTDQENYQTQMQAIADFNIEQYQQAHDLFATLADTDAEALYNLGNTLAYMGKVDKAIAAYENVLKQNPSHADAAYNLEYLKKQTPPPPEQQQGGEKSESQDQAESKSGDASDQQSTQPGNPSAADNAEQQDGEQQSSGDEQSGNAQKEQPEENSTEESAEKTEQTQSAKGQQQEVPATLTPTEQEKPTDTGEQEAPVLSGANQKQKEWLDKIKPDAGRVLRYRLQRQYEEQK